MHTCWVPCTLAEYQLLLKKLLSVFHTLKDMEGLCSLSLSIRTAGDIEAQETKLKLQQGEPVPNPRVIKFWPLGCDLHSFEGSWGQKSKNLWSSKASALRAQPLR